MVWASDYVFWMPCFGGFPACPTVRKPCGRLAWKHLGVPKEELECLWGEGGLGLLPVASTDKRQKMEMLIRYLQSNAM